VEKSVHVEDREITLPEGNVRTVRLYTRGGAIGMGELTDKGELDFRRTAPASDATATRTPSGCSAGIHEYVLPELYGRRHLMVRLYNNDEDTARKFNRTENVRPIPPSDPDFKASTAGGRTRSPSTAAWRTRCISTGPTAWTRPPAREPARVRQSWVNSLALHEHRQRQRLASAPEPPTSSSPEAAEVGPEAVHPALRAPRARSNRPDGRSKG